MRWVSKIFFDEKMAWGTITYSGKRFYLASLKDSINIGFAVSGLAKEEASQFKGSGKLMRHIKIKNFEDINEKNLARLIKMVERKAKCAEY